MSRHPRVNFKLQTTGSIASRNAHLRDDVVYGCLYGAPAPSCLGEEYMAVKYIALQYIIILVTWYANLVWLCALAPYGYKISLGVCTMRPQLF